MAEYTIDKIEYDSNVYKLQDSVSGYITGISSSDVTTALGYTPLSSSSTLDATNLSGTIPAECYTDTDTKMTQTYAAESGYTYWRPLVIGYSSGSAEGFTPSTVTNTAYAFKSLTVQPSSGTIRVGNVSLYKGNYTVKFTPDTLTANRTITVPDATGTLALTSDIPTAPTITLNGSTTTTPSFYAPTTAGTNGYVLKSNGSGAPTWMSATLTDEKVKTTPTTLDVLNGYLTFSSSATETTNTLNKHSSIQIAIDADTVINGQTQLTLGNTIVEGNSGAKIGVLELYGPNQYMIRLTPDTLTNTRLIKLPNKAGTIALTSDIPTVPTIYLNDAPATLYSFYAPTTAGTNGYYLKSNGSGAPTWATIPAGVTVTLNGSTTTTPSFYAPTSAGTDGYVLKSNGSGAPTWTSAVLTDQKLSVAEVTSGSTYYPIVGTGASAATRQYDTTGFKYSANSIRSFITLGNNISEGTTGSKRGAIQIYGTTDRYTQLETLITSTGAGQNTGVVVYFPNKGGTIALTDDIPTVPTITLNGSSTTSPSFYAPTSAGTSGYYLKSNGSGAPTWATIPAGVTVTLNGSATTTPSFYAPTTAGTSGQVLTSNGSGAPTWNGPDFIVEDSSEIIAPLTTVTVSNRDSRFAYTDFSIIFNGPNYYSTLSIVFDNTTYICDLFNQDDEYVYGSLDFSDCPFILYGELSSSGNSVPMNLYLPSDSAQTHTIIIKTPGTLSVTTSSDFDAAVIHVLETNLQSVEGGSY